MDDWFFHVELPPGCLEALIMADIRAAFHDQRFLGVVPNTFRFEPRQAQTFDEWLQRSAAVLEEAQHRGR